MIVFGSRGSDLALTQTRWVAEQIKAATGEDYRIEVMVTAGDRIQDRPLSGIGIKGLFTRELEEALRNGAIDVAVHSLKDLPVEDPDGITLGAVPPRERAFDVLVANPAAVVEGHGPALARLRAGIRLGTSSPRRGLAVRTARGDLAPADVRGNVPTRVDKVRRGDYDAVLLASAGLRRLGLDLSGLIAEELPCEVFTPAPGQGALGIQCRRDDPRVRGLLAAVHDETTLRCVTAERAVLLGLGGGCSMPLGVLVEPLGDQPGRRFRLRAALFGAAPSGEGPVAQLRTAAIGDDPMALAQAVIDEWRPLVGAPLAGRRFAVVRPDGACSGLAASLQNAGADVHVLPWTRTEALDVGEAALREQLQCAALAFTSARGVRAFTAACERHGLEPRRHQVFAVGGGTATELVLLGYTDVTTAQGRGGASLAALLSEHGIAAGAAIGAPGAEQRHGGFERAAGEQGFAVRTLPVYRLHPGEHAGEIPAGLDAFLFTSPSAVAAVARGAGFAACGRAIAIGATTRAALAEAGVDDAVTLDEPTPSALLEVLASREP
ncbi:MAG: hydroxymethylbilane synthase [Planctomycetota bacterium]